MGLFPKKSSDQKPDEKPSKEGSSGGSSPVSNPLAPPSAQKKAGAAHLPPAQPGQQESPRRGSSKSAGGPTPPGGLLPTPDWHHDYGDDLRPPSSAGRPRTEQPQPRPATEPTLKLDSRQASGGKQQSAPIPPAGARAPVGQDAPRPASRQSPAQEQQARMEVLSGGGKYASLHQLLREAAERGASDLHLSRGVPPTIRLDGFLIPLDYPVLSKEVCERLVLNALNPLQRQKFEKEWELDFSLDIADAGRFRVNVHRQRGGIEAAFRIVNDVVLPLRRLGLPGVVEEIARKKSGLTLVTGPTGSGKSTTMASIVDQINNERQEMIITIEDPIEYVHKNKRSIVKQREVTSDTLSFANALRHVLRQDPDVIIVGEMRDMETMETALMAAETGHLVFATLHTPDAVQTVDRMIDVFPPHQQEQVRIQVSNTIQAIVAQQLIPVPGNRGRVVAVEILIANVAVRKIIRSGKTEQLYTAIQTSWEQGMITMDKSLKTLYQQGLVSFDDAISRCKFPLEFDNI